MARQTPEEKKDKGKLESFIKNVYQLLNTVVRARNILFSKPLRDDLNHAWLDVTSKSDDLYAKIRDANYEDLERAGLAGNSLEMKLKSFDAAYSAWSFFGGIRRLKRLFKWTNLLLGSLATVIPLAEILKEFKESAEIGIDEADDPIGGIFPTSDGADTSFSIDDDLDD